jgi:hypothetical protein
MSNSATGGTATVGVASEGTAGIINGPSVRALVPGGAITSVTTSTIKSTDGATAITTAAGGAVTAPVSATIGTDSGTTNHNHILRAGATYCATTQYLQNNVARGYIGASGSGGNLLDATANVGDMVVRSETGRILFTNTGSVNMGSVIAGAWTFGPASGLTTAHKIQGANTGGTILDVSNTDTAVNAALIKFSDGGTAMGFIGSTTTYPLFVANAAEGGLFRVPSTIGNGTLTLSGGIVGLESDIRLKDLTENQDIPGLAAICAITPARYTWKNKEKGEEPHLGFIAQDVLPHIPEAVGKPGSDGMYGFYDRPVIAAAVKAIQEQQALIEALTQRLAALEAK